MTMTHQMISLLTLGPVYGMASQWNDIGCTKRDIVEGFSTLKAPVLSLQRSNKVLHYNLLTCTIFCANRTCKVNDQQLAKGESILSNT